MKNYRISAGNIENSLKKGTTIRYTEQYNRFEKGVLGKIRMRWRKTDPALHFPSPVTGRAVRHPAQALQTQLEGPMKSMDNPG